MPISTLITVPSETFTLVAVKSLSINWRDLNGKVTAQYSLQPYSEDEYGRKTEAPTKPIVGRVDDLFALAATRSADSKPALAIALNAVLTALQEIEHEKGTI